MDMILKAQAGSQRALSHLMRQHAPLVQALARRFEQKQDAFQAGCIGLIKAVRGFDTARNCAFSTYAVPVILGEMRKTRERRFGWRQEKKLNAANRFRDEMLKQFGREPTIDEMADKAGVQRAEMALLLESSRQVIYEGERENMLFLPDPHGEEWLQRFFIRDILDRMPWEYSYILRRRYVFDESQGLIAGKMNTNQSAVSRAEKKARLMFISAWQC